MAHYSQPGRYSADPAIVAAMAKVEAAEKALIDAIRELREATIGSPLIGYHTSVPQPPPPPQQQPQQQQQVQVQQTHLGPPPQQTQTPQGQGAGQMMGGVGGQGLHHVQQAPVPQAPQPQMGIDPVMNSIHRQTHTPTNDTRVLTPSNPFQTTRAKSPEYKYPLSRERMMKLMGATDKSMVYDMKSHVRNKCIELGHPLDKLFSQWDEHLLQRMIDAVHKDVSIKYGWKESTTRLVMMTICQDKVRNEKVKERKRKGLIGTGAGKAPALKDGVVVGHQRKKSRLDDDGDAPADGTDKRRSDDEESELEIGAAQQQLTTENNAGSHQGPQGGFRNAWHENGAPEYTTFPQSFQPTPLLSPQSQLTPLPSPHHHPIPLSHHNVNHNHHHQQQVQVQQRASPHPTAQHGGIQQQQGHGAGGNEALMLHLKAAVGEEAGAGAAGKRRGRAAGRK